MPIIPILWIAGILGSGWAIGKLGEFTGEAAELGRVVVIGGVAYAVYRVAVK